MIRRFIVRVSKPVVTKINNRLNVYKISQLEGK